MGLYTPNGQEIPPGTSIIIDTPKYENVTFIYLGAPEGKPMVKKLYAKTHDYNCCFAKWTAGQVVAPLLEKDFRAIYEEPFEVTWELLEKAKIN